MLITHNTDSQAVVDGLVAAEFVSAGIRRLAAHEAVETFLLQGARVEVRLYLETTPTGTVKSLYVEIDELDKFYTHTGNRSTMGNIQARHVSAVIALAIAIAEVTK